MDGHIRPSSDNRSKWVDEPLAKPYPLDEGLQRAQSMVCLRMGTRSSHRVTIDNDHRCFLFPVHGKFDEIGIYSEQHDVGGYPAADRMHVGHGLGAWAVSGHRVSEG